MWSLPPQPCSPGCYKKVESSHGHIKEPSLHCLTPLSPIYMPWNQKVWEQIIGIPRQTIERTWECVTFWITCNNAKLTVRPAKSIIKTQVNICPGSAWELGSIFWILLALVFSPIHLWLCCHMLSTDQGTDQVRHLITSDWSSITIHAEISVVDAMLWTIVRHLSASIWPYHSISIMLNWHHSCQVKVCLPVKKKAVDWRP